MFPPQGDVIEFLNNTITLLANLQELHSRMAEVE